MSGLDWGHDEAHSVRAALRKRLAGVLERDRIHQVAVVVGELGDHAPLDRSHTVGIAGIDDR